MKTRVLILALPTVLAGAAVVLFLGLSDPEKTLAVGAVLRSSVLTSANTEVTLRLRPGDEPALPLPSVARREKSKAGAGPRSNADHSSTRFEPHRGQQVSPATLPATSTLATAPIAAADPEARAVSREASEEVQFDLAVPFGIRLPAVLVEDSEEALSPAQAKALDNIAGNFLHEISPVKTTLPRPPASTALDPAEVIRWDQLRAAADEQFRVLFGDDAFNQRSVAASKDALSDQ